MSELNLIKTVLFNASSLNEALTRLDELGINYRESQTTDMYCIDSHNVQFWVSRSLRCPLAVFVDNQFFDYEDRKAFLAGQCETVETPVPAASPETTGQHLVIPEPSTDSVDNTCSCLHDCDHPISSGKGRKLYGSLRPKSPHSTKYVFDLGQLRQTLLTERRLKLSQAKGLSS